MPERHSNVLSVRGLTVDYRPRRGHSGVRAVEDVDLDLRVGEGHALVGPSGSGKTTVARAILRLVEPTAGTMVLHGRAVTGLSRRAFRAIRSELQVVFQDPQTSLDPRWPVGRSVAEPLTARRLSRWRTYDETVAELLGRVGLPRSAALRRPYELSIGQQQRVAIARALAAEPSVLVCDEPVAALDASVQAHVLDLLRELQADRGLALLLVTHDLAVAAQLCETTTVMDAGRVVESGPTTEILIRPRHERTAALVAAARRLDPAASRE